MISLRFASLVLWLVLCCVAASAQSLHHDGKLTQYQVDKWKTADGLPDNGIRAILKTSDGYLWLGTSRGLARFDGFAFTVFNSKNTKEITVDVVNSLVEDRDRNLWIATAGGGLLRYQDGKFSLFGEAEGLFSKHISDLALDSSGALWIATSGEGVHQLKDRKIRRYNKKEGLASPFVISLFVDRQGQLWVGRSIGGLQRLVGEYFDTIFAGAKFKDNKAITMVQVENDVITGGNKGVTLFRGSSDVSGGKLSGIGNIHVTSLEVDIHRNLWIATNGEGLLVHDGRTTQRLRVSDGLSSDFIRKIYCDHEGNIWVGTDRSGLNRLRKRIVQNISVTDGLPMEYVRCVFEDRTGGVWFGTNGGGLAQRVNNRFRNFTTRDGLSHNVVISMEHDPWGRLWIGTWGGGMTILDRGKFQEAPLEARNIRVILRARNGDMWVGTNGSGAVRFSKGAAKVFSKEEGLSNPFVGAIVEDKRGRIWVGTSGGGLNEIEGDRVTVYTQKDGLANDFIPALHADAEGDLWICTNGGGLNRLKDGKFFRCTEADGLSDDFLYGIVEDANHNLWLTSTQGIMRVQKPEMIAFMERRISSLPIMRISESDGMASSECAASSQNTICRTQDGKLWFATVAGAVLVDPATLTMDSSAFPVYVEQVLLDDNSLDVQDHVRGDYERGELEIHYTALNFQSAKRMKFKYRLEGFDTYWTNAQSRRVAYYTNVPPGSYRFRVRVELDGQESSHEGSVAITILPPFWMTWWFRTSAGLVVAGGVIFWVRFLSTRKLQRKLQALVAQNALERERARISKDMHDELGSSLTKIALLSDVAKRNQRERSEVAKQFDRISNAAREAATSMDEIVWAVNPRNDTLEGLVGYTAQYAEEYLSLGSIQCRLEIPDSLPDRRVTAEVRHNVFLALKEALNNIVKYSGAREVWLHVRLSDGQCVIELKDDGEGFDLTKVRPFSDGLENMRKRMEEIHSTFHLTSEPGKGTRIVLTFPL